MTPRQREIARHMLGLKDGNRKSYRNRFVADIGHHDYEVLIEMLLAGYLTAHDERYWHLTRVAAESVLRPGETLDPEDFPSLASGAERSASRASTVRAPGLARRP